MIPSFWASLVVQWLRIHLSMQGTQVQCLVRKDSTCRGASKPTRCNYWAQALQLLKSACPGACARQWEATIMRSPRPPARRGEQGLAGGVCRDAGAGGAEGGGPPPGAAQCGGSFQSVSGRHGAAYRGRWRRRCWVTGALGTARRPRGCWRTGGGPESPRGPHLSPFMKPKLPGVFCPAGTPGNWADHSLYPVRTMPEYGEQVSFDPDP